MIFMEEGRILFRGGGVVGAVGRDSWREEMFWQTSVIRFAYRSSSTLIDRCEHDATIPVIQRFFCVEIYILGFWRSLWIWTFWMRDVGSEWTYRVFIKYVSVCLRIFFKIDMS